jgi:hypothetical protein
MSFPAGGYLVAHTDALEAALAFDEECLANYDFGGTSAPDSVDIHDIGRMVGSRMVGMTAIEAAELIRRGPSAPWNTVPIDARLEDAHPDGQLFAAATALQAHFEAIRGVKGAKATKLLAMKRPTLFPIVDERVVSLYRVAAAQKVGIMYPTIASIRDDMLDPATPQALQRLREALNGTGNPKALRLAQLTGLRLRDIVLWQRWEIIGPPQSAPPWPSKIDW